MADRIRPVTAVRDGGTIIYDEGRWAGPPDSAVFCADYWWRRGRIRQEARGRGKAYFLQPEAGGQDESWVLRHYQRGGLIANLSRDRYIWTGCDGSRPMREFRMLSALYNQGLPVPRPVAAAVWRRGMTYTADLLTRAIADTRPLADHLAEQPLSTAGWQVLGAEIARFHAADIWHADLNARNILITSAGAFHLLDFDKARHCCQAQYRRSRSSERPAYSLPRWQRNNLKRLRRSLDKFSALNDGFCFDSENWDTLLKGYMNLG